MDYLRAHPLAAAILTILVAYFTRATVRFAHHRKRMGKYPGPPYHWLWGHLLILGEYRKTKPIRMHGHYLPALLAEDYSLGPVFLFDTYPAGPAILIINDADLAHDVSTVQVYPKSHLLGDALAPVAGPENLVVMEGTLWKKWRTIFNPAFSMTQLMSLVPLVVDSTGVFVDNLDKLASKNEPFRLEEPATYLTIDIIGKVILDHDFKSQTAKNEYVDAMRAQFTWLRDHTSFNPLHIYSPIRPIANLYYTWRMRRYLGKLLDTRLAARAGSTSNTRQRVGIDLALDTYFADYSQGKEDETNLLKMDPKFRQHVIDNFRILLVAGHDTTSSTVAYALYRLSRHPSTLAKLRAEHDEIFGPNPLVAADALKSDPYLLSKLTYTTAVIQETLRLYTPATSLREGTPNLFIKDPSTSNMLSTDGLAVWIESVCMNRSREIWGLDVHDFRPERFLSPEIDDVDPRAFRPFEKGPRNCIGQELAMLEIKIALVLVVRLFDFKAAYDELDLLKGDGTLWAGSEQGRQGVQEVWGDEAYQVLYATAKPRDGMPMRVKRRV
ncbi:cytochrome P450 monooxygenase-like protein [Lophium mytilinum]|uniref:Cytochrome P450 monooxygenase-like protein n=1 Tax=Lophium mytilinum TaxID=390894 RepID=A0A6A6Q921_9PEZI|nr:cytochrome P450 monooxygenase-like protein [Lophium mytilinum]